MPGMREVSGLAARFNLWKASFAFLIAFTFVFAPAKPAQAALADCAEALYDTGALASYLTKQAGEIAGCTDKLAFSPPATAAVGVLVALVYVAGDFSDEATCKSLVNTTISKLLGNMLANAPKVEGALETVFDQIPCAVAQANNLACQGDHLDGKKLMQQFINDAGTSAGAAMAGLPGLDRVFGLMNCSCAVMGTGIETLQRVKEIASDVGACAGTFSSALFSGVEWLHCHMGPCSDYTGICGVPQYQCGGQVAINCQAGGYSRGCYVAQQVNWDSCDKDVAQYCGTQLVCNGSASIGGKTSVAGIFNGKQDARCFCAQGEGFDTAKPGSPCVACTGDGHAVNVNGECQSWTCDDRPGMKLVGYGDTYPKCNYEHTCTGGKVWDPKTNSCSNCPDNTVFNGYDIGGIANAGTCKECAYDETLVYAMRAGTGGSFGNVQQQTCQKLQCEGLTHADAKRPHECVPCKSVFNPGGIKLGGALSKAFGDKPICLDAVEEAAKQPCKGTGQARYPDGSCRPAAKTKDPDPVATKKRQIGPDPVERVSRPGDTNVKTNRIISPVLGDDIGSGSNLGSTAPSAPRNVGSPGGAGTNTYTPPTGGATSPVFSPSRNTH